MQGCNTFAINPSVAAKLFNTNCSIDAAAEYQTAALRNCGAFVDVLH
jgi:hypothetical protein